MRGRHRAHPVERVKQREMQNGGTRDGHRPLVNQRGRGRRPGQRESHGAHERVGKKALHKGALPLGASGVPA